jgi:hypothetical protein
MDAIEPLEHDHRSVEQRRPPETAAEAEDHRPPALAPPAPIAALFDRLRGRPRT